MLRAIYRVLYIYHHVYVDEKWVSERLKKGSEVSFSGFGGLRFFCLKRFGFLCQKVRVWAFEVCVLYAKKGSVRFGSHEMTKILL